MNFTKLALPVIALGAAAVLLTPGSSDAYSLIGGSLSQTQRDFRTFNNFTDNAANNNNTPANQFPGAQGAVMAIWKGSIEWGSELHGNGNGDNHQVGGLGSGGAKLTALAAPTTTSTRSFPVEVVASWRLPRPRSATAGVFATTRVGPGTTVPVRTSAELTFRA